MKLVETGIKWIGNKFVDKLFLEAKIKCSESAYSQKEKWAVEKIRACFFNKYQNKPYYDDLDGYITNNNCIEFAVKYANSVQQKEQRLNSQYVKYHTRKFLEEYPKRKIYKEGIQKVFELIKEMALDSLNYLSLGSDSRNIQATIVRESNEVRNIIYSETNLISSQINQLPSNLIQIFQDALICGDSELQPFYDKLEEIRENFQLKGKFKEAINELNACYQDVTLRTQGKKGDAINLLFCKLLSNIAICHGNLGQHHEAKETIKRACQASLNKISRNAYASIALQSKDENMYATAVSYMQMNLREDENNLEAFLNLQLFAVLLDEDEANNVLNKLDARAEGLSERDDLQNYHEYRALIERFSGKYIQAIEDFTVATQYGYDKLLSQFNIAGVCYLMATHGLDSDFIFTPEVEWNSLRQCYDSLSDMLAKLTNRDIRDLLFPEILRLYLNCCMLLQEDNAIYKNDVEQRVWLLDYEIIRSFVLSCPFSVVEDRKYYEKLNIFDQTLWWLNHSIQKEEYTDAEIIAISGLSEKKFLHPELAYDALLQISLLQKDVEKYEKYRDEMICNGIMVPNFQMMEVCYLELSGNVNEATSKLRALIDRMRHFSDFANAVNFFRRNNHNEEAFDVIRKIIEKKEEGKIHIINPNQFCKSIFGFLLEKNFRLCCRFVEIMQSENLDKELDLQMNLNIAIKQMNFPKIAELSEELFLVTEKEDHLLNSATAFLQYGSLEKSEEKLCQLTYQRLNQDGRWRYNSIYAEIELLRGNNDKAFRYAQISHEDNLDRPKHPSHQYYFSVAVRCGYIDEGLQDTLKFKKENPVAVKYITEITSLDTDEEGNEKLSQEFFDFLEEQKEKMIRWKKDYYEKKVGLYQIADKENGDYENLILQILSCRGSKISIFGGDISALNRERKCLEANKEITVDVLSLIVLSHFDLLGLLDNFERIYFGYSSFLFLQQAYFLHGEISQNYGKIYKWINENESCIKCADGPIDFCDDLKKLFPDHLLGAINVAHETNTPLLYADAVESMVLRMDNITQIEMPELVSINAVVASLKDEHNSRIIRCNLMEFVTFVNFNADDIIFWIKKKNGVSQESLQRFWTCNSTVDVVSFAGVYLTAIKMLKDINPIWAKEFTQCIIGNTVKVRRRVSYYETAIEDVSNGKINYNMPCMHEYMQKYLTIIHYTNLIKGGLKIIFQDDSEILKEIESIDTYNAVTEMIVKTLLGN